MLLFLFIFSPFCHCCCSTLWEITYVPLGGCIFFLLFFLFFLVDNEATECEARSKRERERERERERDIERKNERTAVSWAILYVTTTMASLTLPLQLLPVSSLALFFNGEHSGGISGAILLMEIAAAATTGCCWYCQTCGDDCDWRDNDVVSATLCDCVHGTCPKPSIVQCKLKTNANNNSGGDSGPLNADVHPFSRWEDESSSLFYRRSSMAASVHF